MTNKFGIYIHIPFCTTICPFCNFNVYPQKIAQYDVLANCLLSELEKNLTYFGNKELVSIHFGGGTPSLLPIKYMEKILTMILKNSIASHDCEITIEINPYEYEMQDVDSLYDLGFNRFSIGIQSFDDVKLKYLGRDSSRRSNILFAEKISNSKIKNINFDLIFGIQDETLDTWERDIKFVSNFDINHVSTYFLTIEESTPFWNKKLRGEIIDFSEDLYIKMVESTINILRKNKIYRYEISNFCRESFESKHNMTYWRNGSYLGIGAGAYSSYVDIENKIYQRWTNPRSPKAYFNFLNENSVSEDKVLNSFDTREYVKDSFMMGLRLTNGINIKKLKKIREFSLNQETLDELNDEDLILSNLSNIKLTQKGFNIADYIIFKLIESINFKVA